MRRTILGILAVGLLMNVAAYAQSLADIARENREKQASQDPSSTKPKVITNQDLGEGPEGKPELRNDQPRTGVKSADARSQRLGDQRDEQWTRQIRDQENRVASLQSRLDQIHESLRANTNAQGTYTRYQSIQQDRAAQLQLQLDEQKKKLDAMQDAARHAGAHVSGVEP
jgi:predicted RNase H-like nuclease (RuvC/YqgF family)